MQKKKRVIISSIGIVIFLLASTLALAHFRLPCKTREGNFLTVRILHTPGFRDCPTYDLKIYGSGMVVFKGLGWVDAEGTRIKFIGQDAIQEIVSIIRDTDIFSLDAANACSYTDIPFTVFDLTLDKDTRKVRIDYCDSTGIFEPTSATSVWIEIETNIIRIANIEEWVGTRCEESIEYKLKVREAFLK